MYTDRFPQEVVTTLRFLMKDGSTHEITRNDYEGFHTRPMSWETVIAKFDGLAAPFAIDTVRSRLVDAVRNLEKVPVRELTALLARLRD